MLILVSETGNKRNIENLRNLFRAMVSGRFSEVMDSKYIWSTSFGPAANDHIAIIKKGNGNHSGCD